ncbi:MAG: ABC transporter ATP-binding protein, partial [Bacilli bacterium]|nr:ABC transporter ATP-binding protein [Bacilli bacterium]
NQQNYLGHVNSEVEEMLSGYTVVKAFNAEEKMLAKFESDNQELYKNAWKSQFISGMMHPIMNFVGNLNYVAIAILGAYYVIQGKINVGNIQSFIQYSKNFTQPIGQLAQVMAGFQSMLAASERIFKFLDEEEEIEMPASEVDIKNLKGKVEFHHVKFGYQENRPIIKDFSLKVKEGEKIAIVGPTGAGKTTIVKLLMRFYKLDDGKITLDGEDISTLDKQEYRHAFGMVLQDTWLFSGSVMDNLRYGNLNASDEEVQEAARLAHVDHFIETLPEGYQTELNEDTDNISSGQKQLLTIARAILANPKVMILDEATSNVDTRTEELIQSAMDELMKGRTSFIIAHRLSTIKNADKILVLNHGDIVEIGTHEELLNKKGFYAELYNSQFESLT